MKKRIVVALGGNAIKKAEERGTSVEQLKNVDTAACQIAQLAAEGNEIIITHGNGPQAGSLLIQQEEASKSIPPQNLTICGAMTQGQIGWMLQNRLSFHLVKLGLPRTVCAVVTQVEVDPRDPDFDDPSKPVGPFYTEPEALKYRKEKGWIMKETRPGTWKPWRRVVPSPEPLKIVETEAIQALLKNGVVVVASGGGGVPVQRKGDGELIGVEAVVDKDKAGFILSKELEAEMLLILTDVEHVYIDFNKPNAQLLSTISLDEIQKHYNEGQFSKGSMGPKVEACMRFVDWSGGHAVITSLNKALDAAMGKTGTHIKIG